MKQPSISIITPFFNNETTLADTIESVKGQTFIDWEMILVDDGSTDDSERIIRDYQFQCDKIRYYKRINGVKGGSTCRNIGASLASGKYLIFLDADDLLASTCLEERYNSIVNTNFDFIVYPMGSYVNNVTVNKPYSKLYLKSYEYNFAAGLAPWQITSPIWNRVFFHRIGGFDEKLSRFQDPDLHVRAILTSNKNFLVMSDCEPDCFYRVGQMNKKKQNVVANAGIQFVENIQSYASKFEQKEKLSVALLYNLLTLMILRQQTDMFDVVNLIKELRLKGILYLRHSMVALLLVKLIPVFKPNIIIKIIKRIYAYKLNF